MMARLGAYPMGGCARPMLAAETLVRSLPRRWRLKSCVCRTAANQEMMAMGEPWSSTVTSVFSIHPRMCRSEHIAAQARLQTPSRR